MGKGFTLLSGPEDGFRRADPGVTRMQKEMRRKLIEPRTNATQCPGCDSLLALGKETGESMHVQHANSVMHERKCPICGSKWKEQMFKSLHPEGHQVWVGAPGMKAYGSFRTNEAPKLKA